MGAHFTKEQRAHHFLHFPPEAGGCQDAQPPLRPQPLARLLSWRMDSPVRLTTMAPAVMRSQIASAAVGSSIRRGKLSEENWEPTPSLTGRGKAQAGFCQGLLDNHGSAARTRTPVEGSANTCPKLPTCPNPSQWTQLPIPSSFSGRPKVPMA